MAKLLHVDVIMDDVENNPQCPHGPTLRFRRVTDRGTRDYFACSACRDRKDCRFHRWCDDDGGAAARAPGGGGVPPGPDRGELLARLARARGLAERERAYCQPCALLLLPGERDAHEAHDVMEGVSARQLAHPSELMKPLQNSKKEAQFLFSKQSTDAILGMLLGAGVRHVLCVGTPRVHEEIQSAHGSRLSSLLLDIDSRYHQFFGERQFIRFNCFNNHLFSGDVGREVLRGFLGQDGGEGVALVLDPPFGGRVEPLAHTVRQMSALHRELSPARASPLPVFWIFPYFMEPQILATFPDYHMSDYKVNYENHPLFSKGPKGRKLGSPIRIFTNMSPRELTLPSGEGYRHCDACERWVSSENKHCAECGRCTSKNGQTYVHCSLCRRCVKPSWRHCARCKRCSLTTHKCEQFATRGRCSTCKMEDHTAKNCPLKDVKFEVHQVNRRGKRHNEMHDEPPVKKSKFTQQNEGDFSRKKSNNETKIVSAPKNPKRKKKQTKRYRKNLTTAK
ncbi:rRNA N6-adenosine-methyltransferase ZCCHC4 [Bacillus rossius redtenbacheri]|uniref:rRNA N6-adenosine-methyltransferase ZCCHC4 n=1 Tax=Bacillus rossius redtenbacheri TaxID=93214 RepID=UPI002FDF0307